MTFPVHTHTRKPIHAWQTLLQVHVYIPSLLHGNQSVCAPASILNATPAVASRLFPPEALHLAKEEGAGEVCDGRKP